MGVGKSTVWAQAGKNCLCAISSMPMMPLPRPRSSASPKFSPSSASPISATGRAARDCPADRRRSWRDRDRRRGLFVDPATRALIRERAIAVWIDCDVDTLVERTARRNTRPLLKNGNPREILTRLDAERRPFYAEAPIRVVSENGPHADTARAIIKAIDQWL